MLFVFNKKFINSAIEIAYNQKIILHEFNGKHELDIPALGKLKEVKYQFNIIESPVLVDLDSSRINISVKFLCKLKWGLQFETIFDIYAEMITDPYYDQKNETLDLNIRDVNLLNVQLKKGMQIPNFLSGVANSAIDDILKQETWQQFEQIPLLPLISSVELPEMPSGDKYSLPLNFTGVEVVDQRAIAVGFNLETRESEEIHSIDIKNNADLSVSISGDALNRVLSHWWRYTTHSKTEKISGSLEVKHLDSLVNHVSNLSLELGSKIVSLGFLESNFDVQRAWIDYEGVMKMNKPIIILSQDGFQVTGKVEVMLDAALKMDVKIESRFDVSSILPDRLTPWKDDRVLRKKNRIFTVQKISSKRLIVDLSNTKAKMVVGEDGSISLEITDFDIGLDIDWRLPQQLKKRFEISLEKTVISNYPSLPVSSSLLKENIFGNNIKYDIEMREILTDVNLITIYMNMDFY